MPLVDDLQFVTLLATFLGGVVAATAWAWLGDDHLERTARHIARLNDQLTSFYGPLRYFVHQNDNLAKLNERHRRAHAQDHASRWNDERQTEMSADEASTSVLGARNQYTDRIERNNDRMLRLIEDKYSMADPQDFEVLQQFATDLLRIHTEAGAATSDVPRWFLDREEPIASYRPAFAEQIRRSCESKSAELKRLRELPPQGLVPQDLPRQPSSQGRRVLVLMATSIAIVIIAGVVVLRWRDKYGRVTDIKVPAGSSVEVINLEAPVKPRPIFQRSITVRPVPAAELPEKPIPAFE
ncbi:MAG: hypothetical protein JWN70_581 [Planctomycetaceae bacterium]|nr:hypothetical protein [Planctomycetaceae bacterium]